MSVLLRPKLPRSQGARLESLHNGSIDCWHSATSAERRAVDSAASSAARDPCQWSTSCTVVGRINYAAPAVPVAKRHKKTRILEAGPGADGCSVPARS